MKAAQAKVVKFSGWLAISSLSCESVHIRYELSEGDTELKTGVLYALLHRHIEVFNCQKIMTFRDNICGFPAANSRFATNRVTFFLFKMS